MRSVFRGFIASVAFLAPALAFAGSAEGNKTADAATVQNSDAATTFRPGNPSVTAGEKLRVLDVVRKYTQSVNEGDVRPEIIDELWEHSPDVSNINIRGHQKGFDEIKAKFYAPLFEVLTDRNLRMVTDTREPAVYLFDNTAIVEFYWTIDAKLKDGGKPINMSGRETHVLRKTDGQWKLVHLHYSGMPVEGF